MKIQTNRRLLDARSAQVKINGACHNMRPRHRTFHA